MTCEGFGVPGREDRLGHWWEAGGWKAGGGGGMGGRGGGAGGGAEAASMCWDLHDSTTSLLADSTCQIHSVLPQPIQLGAPHALGVTDQDFWGPQCACQMQVGLLVAVALSRLHRPQGRYLQTCIKHMSTQ